MSNITRQPAKIQSTVATSFLVEVPTTFTGTVTVQGQFTLGTIQDLLAKINQLEERIRVLENK